MQQRELNAKAQAQSISEFEVAKSSVRRYEGYKSIGVKVDADIEKQCIKESVSGNPPCKDYAAELFKLGQMIGADALTELDLFAKHICPSARLGGEFIKKVATEKLDDEGIKKYPRVREAMLAINLSSPYEKMALKMAFFRV